MFKFIAAALAAATLSLTATGTAMADVHIIYLKARFSTAVKRDRALQQVNTYVTNNVNPGDLFTAPQIAAYDAAYKGWPSALTAELRFVDAAGVKRDTLWTQLDAYLSTAANAPVESYGEKWDQELDAANPDADTARYLFVSKIWT
jgi:hypothetical protein